MLFLTAQQVAELLQVPVARVYQAANAGLLPGVVRIGRQVRFERGAFMAWARAGGTPFQHAGSQQTENAGDE